MKLQQVAASCVWNFWLFQMQMGVSANIVPLQLDKVLNSNKPRTGPKK